MAAFTFRRAPGVRWTPRLPDREAMQAGGAAHAAEPHTPCAHGASESACGLELPDSYKLRLVASRHVTPRNPVSCPLEDTALRQWCVRLQNDACPQGTPVEVPVYLKRPHETQG
jgi:hypothetical protein